jgi:dienelactone hydrolase
MSSRMLMVAGIAHTARRAARGMRTPNGDLSDFERRTFTDEHGVTREYYRTGSGDRPVMVLHEIFGLSPADLAFCRRLAQAGFRVYAPVLLGVAGKAENPLYQFQCFARVCVSREFAALSWYRSSPVADALRVLGRRIYDEHGEPGFGVIGLCLTGNFALVMMADRHLVAPVLGEPTLPFAFSRKGRGALGLSDDEIASVRQGIREGRTVLGFRFRSDRLCPSERFASLCATFRDGFEPHEIEAPPNGGDHSVLAADYDPAWEPSREAFARLVSFLDERL